MDENGADSLLVAVAALTTKLLGRAVTACTAAGPGTGQHQVRVQLMQEAERPNSLLLRVRDSGAGLPDDGPTLQRVFAPLRPHLGFPCFMPQELALRTTCGEEGLLRRYRLVAASHGELAVSENTREVKPQGLHLTGTQAAVAIDTRQIPPEDVVACVEQALGMLHTLRPAVQLTLQLQEVLLPGDGDEGRHPTDHTAVLEPLADPALPPLQRLHAGLAAEYEVMTPLAAAAIQPEQQNREGPPLLTFLGVGEAGRGCGPAGACPRGCKWAVRAGVVLRLPDHTALQAATAVALPAADEEPLNASHTSAVADGPFELSVYVFRNFTLQLGPQQAVVKALERCEWAAYGFSLVEVSPGGNGPLTLALRCAQPRSGAALTAAVLHLQSEDVVGEATKGRPQTLAASHETRTVRAALEGALRELRAQCPGVMAGRRERSVMRAVPKVAAAVAGILLRCQSEGVAVEACDLLGAADMHTLQEALEAALHSVAATQPSPA